MNAQEFSAKVADFKAEITALPDVDDPDHIQQTVTRLEQVHFTPMLRLPVDQFLSFSKADLLAEIDRVAALSEHDIRAQGVEMTRSLEETKLEQIGLLVYHFKLLTKLRQDDPETWDEIDELYVDD
jgi:NifB/MoaA-like Fe-S oxidoreductase